MILLDTCVISEALRPKPSSQVMAWLESLPENRVFIPVIVLGELRKGVDRLDRGAQRLICGWNSYRSDSAGASSTWIKKPLSAGVPSTPGWNGRGTACPLSTV